MKPLDLILVSKAALQAAGPRKPSQTWLRRAVSANYYALFHCVARDGADLLIGGVSATRSDRAWVQTYRALEHGYAKSQCLNREVLRRFPRAIEDLANAFVQLQGKRHQADYNPLAAFTKSVVRADIKLAETAILAFRKERAADRRAFCAWVLFKVPRN